METALIQALQNSQSWEVAKVLDSITGTIWPHSRTTYTGDLVVRCTEDYTPITGHAWTLTLTLNNSRIAAATYQRLGEEAVQVQEAASPRVQYA